MYRACPRQPSRSERERHPRPFENVIRFRAVHFLQLRVPQSRPQETAAESPDRSKIFQLKERSVQLFHAKMVRVRGMRSKLPGNRQSKYQCSLPKHRSLLPPKVEMAEEEKAEPDPLPVSTHKGQHS